MVFPGCLGHPRSPTLGSPHPARQTRGYHPHIGHWLQTTVIPLALIANVKYWQTARIPVSENGVKRKRNIRIRKNVFIVHRKWCYNSVAQNSDFFFMKYVSLWAPRAAWHASKPYSISCHVSANVTSDAVVVACGMRCRRVWRSAICCW
jgi:hypothetical protein